MSQLESKEKENSILFLVRDAGIILALVSVVLASGAFMLHELVAMLF